MTSSDWVIGCLICVSFLTGLFMAAGALDDGIYVFGLALAGFSCCFALGQIRRHYDTMDAARIPASEHG